MKVGWDCGLNTSIRWAFRTRLSSSLMTSRPVDPDVRRLAARISAAQGPEILSMSAGLEQQGLEVPQPGDDPRDFEHSEAGHDDSMMGKLTEQEMTRLARARGSTFDRLFLRG